MKKLELSLDTAERFALFLDADMAENLAREYYRGLLFVGEDEKELLAGMVWQYHNFDEEKDTESGIEWIKVNDMETAEQMFADYGAYVKNDGVKHSRFVIPVKDNEKAYEAAKAAGFRVVLGEGDDIIVELSALSALPIMKSRKLPDSVGCLSQITLRKYRKAIVKCIAQGRKGVCEDLGLLPMDWFDLDASSYCETDDGVAGFLLFHRRPSGVFALQLMVALFKNSQPELIAMVKNSIMYLEANYPPDTKVVLDRHNHASLLLAEKLLPRGFGIPVYTGTRAEE